MEQKAKRIVLTREDYDRLTNLLREQKGKLPEKQLGPLRQELKRARVVDSDAVPDDVITMNSTALVRVEGTSSCMSWTIVYPEDADMDEGRISVLEPLGTALLGYQAGDAVDWDLPAGRRRYRVVAVLYQPESVGNQEPAES